MKKISLFLSFVFVLVVAGMWATGANAFERYFDPATGTGNCTSCHGAFTDGTSPKGSVFPSDDKHTMHRSSSYMTPIVTYAILQKMKETRSLVLLMEQVIIPVSDVLDVMQNSG